MARGLVHGAAQMFGEKLGKPIHVTQGSAQVVRYRIGKGFEFLIRGSQFRGTFRDALLQLDILPSDHHGFEWI